MPHGYLRISKEDEANQESESINNQKLIIEKYAEEHGFIITKFYSDDGYTGTNFDRPEFKKMLDDIELKKINTVITKDMSRFGRDYIEVGRYIENYFPLKKVRYISINDGIDTFANNNINDMTPIKSVMNDMYSKDISNKVKSAMMALAKQGKSIKAFPPYGYKKHPTEKGQLIIDENTAPVVKKIFEMYYNGFTKTAIAKTLQEQGIPTPLKYKEMTCSYKNPNARKTYIWNNASIGNILRDVIYIGTLEQHKYAKLNYKSKKTINVDKHLHIITKNCHEPIISLELYQKVQEILDKKSNEYNYTENRYSSRVSRSGLLW